MLASQLVWAQPVARMTGYVDLHTYAATGQRMPFWLRTNQWGVVPLNAPAASLRLSLCREYRPADSSLTRKFDWGFGILAVGTLAHNGTQPNHYPVFLPAAYLKMRLGKLELWGGRRPQVVGLIDTLLSSGSYAVSSNALPIPQIQLLLPDFVPLHFLNDVIALKAGFSHGWFNVPYIQGAMIHEKFIYARFGRPASNLHVLAGINHQVQWGGHAKYLINSPVANDGQLTTDFGDYLKSVVLGQIPKDLGNVRYGSFDAANRIGNHLGSIDIGISLDRPASSWLIYHQHPYEDASGLSGRNVPDGLYGLRWLNRGASADRRHPFWHWRRIVGELLVTTDQSGPYFSRPGQSYKGADNYYNHSQYVEGWSYRGQTLGTPFLIPRPDLAATSEPGEFYVPSNRVVAYYAAFEALVKSRMAVTGRFSYSRNFGSYSTPFRTVENQFSACLQLNTPVSTSRKSQLLIDLAFDQGALLENNLGVHAGFRRYW